jgi:phosphoribosyl-ATP pyrophosphohydrolase/phosphoribosyl-AMP cyclohydrolase/histidinol dehydrogenase
LKNRKANPPEGSYSAKLFADQKLLMRKIMEEAFEVTQASDRRNTIWEIADTLYFLSVAATAQGIEWSEIEAELGGRSK